MQLLSGFPPEYVFMAKGAPARASEIARGVCPPVGEWLARAVASAVKKNVPITNPTINLYDLRKPPGKREEVQIHGRIAGKTLFD
jgi:hypothetical protein